MNTHGCRPCGHLPTTSKYTHSGTLHIPFEDSNTTLPPNISLALYGLWVNIEPPCSFFKYNSITGNGPQWSTTSRTSRVGHALRDLCNTVVLHHVIYMYVHSGNLEQMMTRDVSGKEEVQGLAILTD